MEGTQNTTNEEAVEMAKIDFYNVKKRAKLKSRKAIVRKPFTRERLRRAYKSVMLCAPPMMMAQT